MWVLFLFMGLLLVGLAFGYFLEFWKWNAEQADKRIASWEYGKVKLND